MTWFIKTVLFVLVLALYAAAAQAGICDYFPSCELPRFERGE